MYKSLIEPHLRYCCPVWGAAGNTALQKLQKLQNRAARIVTNSPYDAHSEPLIQKLGWPTIKQLIESETAKVVYKALHNEAPDYLKGLFHRLSDTQSSFHFIFHFNFFIHGNPLNNKYCFTGSHAKTKSNNN